MGLNSSKPTDNLTKQEIKELQDTFELFDNDKSGSISADELGEVMRALGQNPTPEELDVMLHDVDTDGSGTIDVDEFINMMAKRSKGYEKEVKMAFKVLNKGGYITAAELKLMYSTIGQTVTQREISQLLAVAEADKQGRVTYKQFSTMMKAILEEKDRKKSDATSSATEEAPPQEGKAITEQTP